MSSPSNSLPAGQARVARYRIRDASGTLVAIHCRQDGSDGKRMWWEQPDGTPGLGGLSVADLPLYGIERLNGSPTVILVEGEKAAEALLAIGIQAVGTVTGAAGPRAPSTGRADRPASAYGRTTTGLAGPTWRGSAPCWSASPPTTCLDQLARRP